MEVEDSLKDLQEVEMGLVRREIGKKGSKPLKDCEADVTKYKGSWEEMEDKDVRSKSKAM